MARSLGEGGGGGGRLGEAADAVQDEVDDVPLPALEIGRSSRLDADGGRHRAGMDQREPAERDDAEQELRRLTRSASSRPSSALMAASASWPAERWSTPSGAWLRSALPARSAG